MSAVQAYSSIHNFDHNKNTNAKKIINLKEAISENIDRRDLTVFASKCDFIIYAFVSTFFALVTIVLDIVRMDMIKNKGVVSLNTSAKELAIINLLFGGSLVLTSSSLNTLSNNFFKLFNNKCSNEDLLENNEFHQFVIEKIKVKKIYHSDIDMLKELYYRDIDNQSNRT